MPSRPSAAASRRLSRGNPPSMSRRAARGASTRVANWRAVSTTICWPSSRDRSNTAPLEPLADLAGVGVDVLDLGRRVELPLGGRVLDARPEQLGLAVLVGLLA